MGDIAIGGLTLAMFQYSHDTPGNCLNEKEDKDLFHPDGKLIAFISSNYCNEYHPDYYHLSKEYIEANKQKFKEYNNNRGRKKIQRVKKNKRVDGGTNTQFGSCIVFGLIVGDKVHGIKVFRKLSGNISKLTHDEAQSPTYIPEILGRLFAYINAQKPGINMRYVSHSITLTNMTAKYTLPEGCIIQLYELRRLLDYSPYNLKYWDCDSIIFNYNGKVNHLVISIFKQIAPDRITSIEICPEGNIHIYGGNDIAEIKNMIDLTIRLLDENKENIIIHGFRASPKAKPRPDFSTFVVPSD